MAAHIRRREFVTALVGALSAWPIAARAQPRAMPTVGFLSSASAAGSAQFLTAVRAGLNGAGYVEGRNVAIEARWGDGQTERLPALAAELVRRQVSVILVNNDATLPAKAATSTIPIVFVTGADPVKLGFVASYNRPGGNITGVSFFSNTLGSKRMDLLHEMAPRATRVAFLINPSSSNTENDLPETQAAARIFGLQLRVLLASNEREIDAVFADLGHQRPDALYVNADAYFTTRRKDILELVSRLALPSMHSSRDWVVDGALMSYGTDIRDAYRQAGVYAGRVLKGDKPSELPVVQPAKFELVVNLKTASAIGLDVPQMMLALADEVIE